MTGFAKSKYRLFAMFAILGNSIIFPACATQTAVNADWAKAPFHYVVVDQNIRDVLHELFAAASVPVEIADSVRGHIHSRWPDNNVGDYLKHLAQANGLEWYFDGSTMHICKANEVETKSIPAHGVDFSTLSGRLILAGANDTRFKVRPGTAPDTMQVSGPPAFISTVEQSIAAISGGATGVAGANGQVVTVFNGSDAPKTSVFASPSL